jgi:hypothetical protein
MAGGPRYVTNSGTIAGLFRSSPIFLLNSKPREAGASFWPIAEAARTGVAGIIHGLADTDPGEWTGQITNPQDFRGTER